MQASLSNQPLKNLAKKKLKAIFALNDKFIVLKIPLIVVIELFDARVMPTCINIWPRNMEIHV